MEARGSSVERRARAKMAAMEFYRQEFGVSNLLARSPIGVEVAKSIDRLLDVALDEYVAEQRRNAPDEDAQELAAR